MSTPLPKPVNPFKHLAAALANEVQAALALPDTKVPPSQKEEAKQFAATYVPWFRHLGARIDYETNRPEIIGCLGLLAKDYKEREKFRAALDQIDREVAAAAAARARSS